MIRAESHHVYIVLVMTVQPSPSLSGSPSHNTFVVYSIAVITRRIGHSVKHYTCSLSSLFAENNYYALVSTSTTGWTIVPTVAVSEKPAAAALGFTIDQSKASSCSVNSLAWSEEAKVSNTTARRAQLNAWLTYYHREWLPATVVPPSGRRGLCLL